ncbi:DUF1178 family protein [Phaeobacter gallaeciensis]|uniref:DUF1178 domain-containing protein n=1 Tax=Phaeobacter gallaeciensis TaxID=60890 RepID=A0AAC9ZCD7_9RHOB|nr:DUF1178 family protein [Phaeobacter gallaeciensis]AHD10592.1 Uncharacterized protein in bacteria [Phaeobacter gallaeciensis DSM 26640]ATE93855.1 putative protein in bacteria [Phaeobacter gallaeciensis]ATE96324.1 putative protein in bacteria [Phaeobacter gallaeciensis]ATF02519.1 putative protein in bacteria [Phaeobacter gallaeciensis]ATF06899.1 putative protein in bacteria [Phaeobacter gallaeciensis]
MIQYALKCAEGHRFDSWFQSAAAFDKLAAAGMVSCAQCGSCQVEKAIMAPRVRPGRKAVSPVGEAERDQGRSAEATKPPASAPATVDAPSTPATVAPGAGALSTPSGEIEAAVAELRRRVEKNSDYVGKDFASEARAMHLGDAPERAIHGEAKPEEAKALIEEGVPVLPLPFLPNRKTN